MKILVNVPDGIYCDETIESTCPLLNNIYDGGIGFSVCNYTNNELEGVPFNDSFICVKDGQCPANPENLAIKLLSDNQDDGKTSMLTFTLKNTLTNIVNSLNGL